MLKITTSEAIPVNPSADRVAFDYGIAAFQSGKYEEAIVRFNEAIKIAPRVANYWHWLGDANARATHFSEAIKAYTNALEIAPNYRPSVVNRGICKMWMGDFKAAAADFDNVISRTPVDAWTGWSYRARGICNVGLGNRSQAIDDLEMYLKVFPKPTDRELVEGWIEALKQ
jgi:tetratricopeptide (TPR) repeat protein